MKKLKVALARNYNKVRTSFLKFKMSDEPNKIKLLKNVHKGERCFIIGNGPSLSTGDLDLIKNEVTFSCNMIYELLPKTKWEPYYYFSHDPGYIKRITQEIKQVPAKKKFIGYYYDTAFKVFHDYRGKIADYIYYIKKNDNVGGGVDFSNDVNKYVNACGSVSYAMLQFAVYMGFKEIYLLGFDHNLNSKTEAIHFKGYENTGNKSVTVNMDGLTQGFIQTKEVCERLGVKISNCTRGGKLEVFNRENLEDVLV